MSTKEILRRLDRLELAVFGDQKKFAKDVTKIPAKNPELDFSINIRAFARRFVADKSGPKRFVLLLAYLAKGEVGKDVELGVIRKEWDTMSAKSLLGKFNRFYPNEAKTQGWIDSSKYGIYCLGDSWQEVCQE